MAGRKVRRAQSAPAHPPMDRETWSRQRRQAAAALTVLGFVCIFASAASLFDFRGWLALFLFAAAVGLLIVGWRVWQSGHLLSDEYRDQVFRAAGREGGEVTLRHLQREKLRLILKGTFLEGL